MNSTLSITIRVAAAQAQAALSQVQSQVNQVQKSANSVGSGAAAGNSFSGFVKSAKIAGYTLTTAFSLPIIAAGKNLMSFVLDNETAAANLAKVYGDNLGPATAAQTKEIANLINYFKLLSDEYGVSQTEVINVGAAWAQAGLQGRDLALAVNNTMKAMVIGDMNSADATQALIAIQAQYHASTTDLMNILNDLNTVENATAVSMSDLITAFSKSAGAAATSGVDYQHLAALIAALVPASGSAATAGNSLKTIFSNILAPTKKAADLLASLGFNTSSAAYQSENATKRLEDLSVQFTKLTGTQKAQVSATIASRYQVNRFDVLMQDIANHISNVNKGLADNGNAFSYYGIALDKTANPALTKFQQASNNAKVANQELQTVLQSDPKRLSEIGNMIKNDLADVMVKLVPLIIQIAGTISQLVTWFSNLSPAVQKVVGYFLLLLAAIGPISFYIGAFSTVFALLFSSLKLILSPLGAVLKLFGMFGGSGAAASAAATEVSASNLKAEESYSRLGTVAGSVWSGIVDATLGAISTILGAIADFGTTATTEFDAGMAAIAASADTGMAAITGTITTASESWPVIASMSLDLFVSEFEAAFAAILALTGAEMAAIEGEMAAGAETIDMVWSEALGAWVAEWELAAAEAEAIAAASSITLAAEMTAGAEAGVVGSSGILAKFGGFVSKALTAIPALLLNPWVLGAAAIAGTLYLLRDHLGQIWADIVTGVNKAFNLLPEAVQSGLKATVQTIANAAIQVYEWFSYLNPFAHHSPSLVENVTAGMAVVTAQFKQLNNIQGPVMGAYNLLQKFGGALADLQRIGTNTQRASDISEIAKIDPAAIPAYKALSAEVDALTPQMNALNNAIRVQQEVVDNWQAALDNANAALDTQQKLLTNLQATQQKYEDLMNGAKDAIQTYANTQIQGQQAMSDAIFNNTQAQKALQLQMMQMEDATGPIDDVTSSLAALQGQIEQLQGEEKSLRQAGAGSEILGGIQGQISSLQGQQSGLQGTQAAYSALSDQLAKLQQQGQELDLENSLQFDGLTRQIDQAANAMAELPFSAIMKGINANKSALAGYTAEYNNATAAVNKQQAAVDAATAARDKIQASYDVENKKLSTLQASYQKINQAIQDINNSLQTMGSSASSATSAASKAAAGSGSTLASGAGDFADAGLGGSLTSGTNGDISDLMKQAQDQIKKNIGNIDLLAPIKDKFNQLKKWIDGNAPSFFSGINTALKGMHLDTSSISNALSAFGNSDTGKTLKDMTTTFGKLAGIMGKALKPIFVDTAKNLARAFDDFQKDVLPKLIPELKAFGNMIGGIWNILKPFIYFFVGTFLVQLKLLWPIIQGAVGPILDLFFNVWGDVISILTDVMNFIGDLFKGKWGAAWNDILQLVKDVWKLIEDLINGAVAIVIGILQGLWTDIVWIFGGMTSAVWDTLVSWWNTVYHFFASIPGWIMTALKWVLSGIASIFSTGWNAAWNAVKSAWNTIYNFVTGIPGQMTRALSSLASTLSSVFGNAFSAAKNTVSTWINNIFNAVSGLPGRITGLAKQLTSAGASILSNIWSGLSSAASTALQNVGSFAATITDSIKNHIDDVLQLPWVIKIDTKIPGVPTFGPYTALKRFARGGIANSATAGIFGEAGPEVIIPLTNAKRAMDLVNQSGLLQLIAPMMQSKSNLDNAGKQVSQAGNRASATRPGIAYQDNSTTNVHFHGDLSFPNITSPDDAKDFLDNITRLARKP